MKQNTTENISIKPNVLSVALWKTKKVLRNSIFLISKFIFGEKVYVRFKIVKYIYDFFAKVFSVLNFAQRKQARYEEANQSDPWFVPEATRYLDKILKPNFVGLEWGTGRSTIWFARRVKKVNSIEGKRSWFHKVKKNLIKEGLSKKVSLQLAEVTTDYNFKPYEIERYVSKVDKFRDESLDFVLVDGQFRIECLERCYKKIRPGGFLILDNSDLPEFNHYHKKWKNLKSITFTNCVWETTIFQKKNK
jgi:predicted O-methyltransferase YrrM